MIQPGDVVIALFPGAQQTKSRPAVVISTVAYNSTRPDVVLSLLTTQRPKSLTMFDYELQDWASAGLHSSSLFRVYLTMAVQTSIRVIGHLSDRDWQEVQNRLKLALAVT